MWYCLLMAMECACSMLQCHHCGAVLRHKHRKRQKCRLKVPGCFLSSLVASCTSVRGAPCLVCRILPLGGSSVAELESGSTLRSLIHSAPLHTSHKGHPMDAKLGSHCSSASDIWIQLQSNVLHTHSCLTIAVNGDYHLLVSTP